MVKPRDDKDAAQDLARDLADIAGQLASLKGEARAWLSDSNYNTLKLRLESAHSAVEAAVVGTSVTTQEEGLGLQLVPRLTATGTREECLCREVRYTHEEISPARPLEALRRAHRGCGEGGCSEANRLEFRVCALYA